MFIVIEIQTFANGSVSTLTYQYDTLMKAEAKYHTILSGAAISVLPCHAAVIMTNAGTVCKSEFYRHEEEEQIAE